MTTNISPAAIIGLACRLPGAECPDAFWTVLAEQRCTVSDAPQGRWPVSRFLHPRASEAGFAYSAAGGYLDDPFSFDPTVFGIAPREAQQMDPQQRLLLEVVWEALEDAGLPPSRLAGTPIGVYVGASNVDYQSASTNDLASIESHFMTGNSLSIIANRVSYIFDWRGPSQTVDTACSSSFVAVAQALGDLSRGVVDTAVVAGVNMLLSPAPFIGFSRARMLSPTGRCRPFSARADGYVRSEGAVAFVLRRPEAVGKARVRASILAAGVNSDGRTVGISLPSAEGQMRLLQQVYQQSCIDPTSLAFVEAHGTGTRVGDPAEARAIGCVLGAGRSSPLPVGSAKSNVGHLESASGAVGLLKAILSMERRVFPATLELDDLNPDIDFEALNLAPAGTSVTLDPEGILRAGICNYGFGGTNAHVVIESATPARPEPPESGAPRLLMLTAQSAEALSALAARSGQMLRAGDTTVAALASGLAYQRERLPVRVALPARDLETVVAALDRLAEGQDSGQRGTAPTGEARLAFVYSGNGCQWDGMGREALQRSASFRRHIGAIDRMFLPIAGWSLEQALAGTAGPVELALTSIAQPLIFGVQAALTLALAEEGVRPDLVLGHSVGEVAAAWASGALDMEAALHLVHVRSRHQEAVRARGRMAVLACGEAAARDFLATSAAADVQIAALNGPSSTTVSGPETAISRVLAAARARRIACLVLDIDYPFHSAILDGAEADLCADLSSLRCGSPSTRMISTVTGLPVTAAELQSRYWWRNVREPVRFQQAIETAAADGVTMFLEVGPRPILTTSISETLARRGASGVVLPSLTEPAVDEGADPVLAAAARLLVHGARVTDASVFGPEPAAPLALPRLPWRRQRFVLNRTAEAMTIMGHPFGGPGPHPLLGYRMAPGSPERRSLVDAHAAHVFADHKVGQDIVVPGAALVEMMLAVGREELGAGPMVLEDVDLIQPLTLPLDAMREVSTTWVASSQHVDIRSRPRFSTEGWVQHAKGRVRRLEAAPREAHPLPRAEATLHGADEVYDRAAAHGLVYGGTFRRVRRVLRDGDTALVEIDPPGARDPGAPPFLLHPVSLDAALHSLFLDKTPASEGLTAHLPIRFGRVSLWVDDPQVRRAVVQRRKETGRTSVVDVYLMDGAGHILALVEGLVFRSVTIEGARADGQRLRLDWLDLPPPSVVASPTPASVAAAWPRDVPGETAAWRLVQAFTLALVWRMIQSAERNALRSGRHEALLAHLAANRLAWRIDGQWRLADRGPPHAPETIIQALMAAHPSANAEILLCVNALRRLPAWLEGEEAEWPAGLREQFEAESGRIMPCAAALAAVARRWCEDRGGVPPTILLPEPWNFALVRALLPLGAGGRARLVLAGRSQDAFEGFMGRLPSADGLVFDDLLAEPSQTKAGLALRLVVGAGASEADDLPALAARLETGAGILFASPTPDIALSVLLDGCGEAPGSSAAILSQDGFDAVEHGVSPDGGWSIACARRSPAAEHARVLVLTGGSGSFGRSLADHLRRDGSMPAGWQVLEEGDGDSTEPALDAWLAEPGARTIIDLADIEPDGVPSDQILRGLQHLRRRLALVSQAGGRVGLWRVHRDATGAAPAAVASSLWAFCRVAANEFPTVDLRRLDLAGTLTPREAAQALLSVLPGIGGETEVAITPAGVAVPRAGIGQAQSSRAPADGQAARLRFPEPGKLAGAVWELEPLRPPSEGDVTVKVAATGLNFRDVMLALGVLDEDLLGSGLSRAALGFEFSGEVTAVGPGVSRLQPGDRVMGFAAGAFASHVTVPAASTMAIPAGLSLEEGGTIPVAFCTAWHALVRVARLEKGETVLIHGAAGAVGLAAIQIARGRGARILATAGTEDRRTVARLAGADAVFDSRSLAFADEIRGSEGGVDVVLNSLAGEAMIQGLGLVRPFGRFIELGKRDYLDNTVVGLRPLLRNVTYANVDLDEVLASRPADAAAVIDAVAEAFARGALTPLPHRVFPGEAAHQAVRLMQNAGQVGKILVRPAGRARPAQAPARPFRAPGDTILIVGGTSGFGFETACWLAARGARRIVLGSRRGEVAPELQARLDDCRRTGAEILVDRVDLADADSVESFVKRAEARLGPVVGVVHTAMVLSDGLIEGLDSDAVRAVLAPKVDGILTLERALGDRALDFFVVYSSITTLIGNPGQGAYVAANAFMEGVVRRRRAAGRPGLAVAWGAISGAGVMMQRADLEDRLRRTTGLAGLPVGQALDHLGALLAAGDAAPPVAYVSEIAGGEAAERLVLMRSPAFEGLMAHQGKARRHVAAADFVRQLQSAGPDQALAITLSMLAEETAAILQLPVTSIDPLKPLNELGMDSLMALELRMEVEKRCRIELPLMSISGRSLRDLAERILAGLVRDDGGRGAGAQEGRAGDAARQDRAVLDAVTLKDLGAAHAVDEGHLDVDALAAAVDKRVGQQVGPRRRSS
ncbi:MAG: SDR family NAD(P)-dependent oxidoreductase [Alsobacter sp.]